eukprot:CAMPEP_0204199278 /NCGR_PEP_ID=MMETSP0361-20130328/65896_1 /ASSEMBLY_ACC=CAM_ASM_000343 /TAXON_ID=268821 /ORGANISM="Scrippsiella Hangoei, Strain SHTV-5" /LENGTH=137 /DNA_ID=CAMNT_0051161535 /DNA_START=33 /DNA_END=446 /DNA_ORIENTATION=-
MNLLRRLTTGTAKVVLLRHSHADLLKSVFSCQSACQSAHRKQGSHGLRPRHAGQVGIAVPQVVSSCADTLSSAHVSYSALELLPYTGQTAVRSLSTFTLLWDSPTALRSSKSTSTIFSFWSSRAHLHILVVSEALRA